tara:strand:- start:285 stop:545 length:261 start_codon:yes stop_codon:yes gene_type:complete
MIQVGDKVRSFDFANSRDIDGERACYVEGRVEEFVTRQGCQRYRILVERCVFGGKEVDGRAGTYVFPPVNGTPTPFGGLTCFVELV